MHIKIICHGCQHRFRRTAAQVLSEDRCPRCASTDIDVDDFGDDIYPSCPVCGGPGEMLGHLGNVTWWRCRNCGIDFQGRAASKQASGDFDTSEYGIFGGDGGGAWPGAYEDGYYDGYLWGDGDNEAQRLAPDASDTYKRGYRDGYADAKAGKQPKTLIEEIKSAASRRTASPVYVRGDEWSVSYETKWAPGPQMVTLNVFKIVDEPNEWGGVGRVVHHPEHNGKQFPSMEEADAYALANGLIHPYKSSARKTAAVGWYATADQMMAAAGYLSREWGDHGYGIKQADEEGVFDCRHSDGSRWQIRADRWGNTSDVKEASRKTAQFFDDRGTKKWYFLFPEGITDSGKGNYQAVKSNDGAYAVVNLSTNEIVASGVSWYGNSWGAIEDARRWNANPALAPDTTGGNDYTGLIPGTASRRTAYSSVCEWCGQEGCSPNCPGPPGSAVCPLCGGGASVDFEGNIKCNDPQGCGYGWGGDRGLTFDGEPRFSRHTASPEGFARRIATKRGQIANDILRTNPGMTRKVALSLADEAIRRYPKAVR